MIRAIDVIFITTSPMADSHARDDMLGLKVLWSY